jgi:pyruvate,water dikinase
MSLEKRILKFVKNKILKIEKSKSEHSIDKIVKFAFGWHLAVTARSFTHLGFLYNYLIKYKKIKSPLQEIISNLNVHDDFYLSGIYGQDTNKERYKDNTSGMDKKSFNDFELAEYNYFDRITDIKNTIDPDLNSSIQNTQIQSNFYQYMSRKLQASIIRREQLKIVLIKEYRKFRPIYLEKARTLVEDNKINKLDDIFYFRKEEIDNNLNDIKNIDEILDKRKKTYMKLCLSTVPVNFFGDEPVLNHTIDDSPFDTLNGIGCSQGKVSGVPRVLIKPDQDIDIEDNNIIITKFADPSWTPYLLKSKGMITEVGGILSHLATIAREFKIPFIVGVKNATQILKNKQEIEIDGQTGFVQVIN